MAILRNRTNDSPEKTIALTDLNVVEQLDMDYQQKISGGKSSVGHWFKKNGVSLGIAGGEMGGALGVFTAIAVLGD